MHTGVADRAIDADVARRGHAASAASPRRMQAGFSLVELMVTVTVATVLLVIAIPSFRNLMLSNRLSTTANEMVRALNLAKLEAIKRNTNVQFCSNSSSANQPGPLGSACTTQLGAVYAQRGPAAASTVRSAPTLPSSVQVKGSAVAVRFSAQGLGYLPGTTNYPAGPPAVLLDLCSASLSSGNHRTISMTTGAIITVDTANGACP
jgi:type IV fimbrial biogenesis protein FimT